MNKLMKIKKFIPIYFKAMRNKNTPKAAKFLGILAIAYAILPADVIPDTIPILGVLDDATILPLLIYLTTKMIPEDIYNEEKVAVK